MNVLKKLIPILLIVVAACNAPQKLIVQKWKIDNVEFLDSLNTFTAEQKQTMTNNLKTKLSFAFLPDSTFQVNNEGNLMTGKWWLSTDNKTLHTDINYKITESKLYSVKKKTLKFSSTGEENQGFIFICSPVTDTK